MRSKIKLSFRIDKIWLLAILIAVVILDQLTKFWAFNSLKDAPEHIIWVLDFRLLFNKGAVLGRGAEFGYFFIIISIIIVLVFLGLVFLKNKYPIQETKYLIAFALVAGGAAGNASDRIFRDDRAVVDFIDFWEWPVFNIADAAITIGVIILITIFLLETKSIKNSDEIQAE